MIIRKLSLTASIALSLLATFAPAQEYAASSPGGGGGFSASLGLYQADSKVQSPSGSEDSDPYSVGIAIGYDFDFYWGHLFSPQLGYIQHAVNSEDDYGSYKMTTIYVLYDFVYKPSWFAQNMSVRYGVGNFIKKIDGDGGTVTVPNGSGTATAYRPESSTSHSGNFNLGLQWDFGAIQKTWGVRFYAFAFDV